MKKFKLNSVLLVLFSLTVFASCDRDDDKTPDPVKETVKNALATEVTGPATGKVNTELSYEVTFLPDNSCGEFTKFTEATIGTVKGLQVEVKYPEVCTQQVATPKKAVYKFKSAEKGTFEIKFKKSATEFIIQKVVID
ncbi:hypothetical protein D0817_05885 [Flavobacterium cupreum]|uniref:Lipoprotein n=1 Tax=Flavobacterium cupreum TaxID=2133766 RepID=A0A434AAN1_9FLAO|nr:hypothetical protein [Flavobacterium cupreum]RUT71404.1 hypothetical protein D0817_05885 [Flavobacterium cupreum]